MSKKVRIGLLAGILLVLFFVGRALGWAEFFEVEQLQLAVENAGMWGWALYVVAFTVGLLIQLPGLGFVAVAVLAYGKVLGGILAYLGGVVALTISFLVVRFVGGKALTETNNRTIKKILNLLDERPLIAVTLTRIFVQFNPPINYALAMSNVSARNFILGSFLGLAPVIFVFALLFDFLKQWI